MTLAASALSCRLPLPSKGWEWQSPVAAWKHMCSGRHNAVITFATKSTKRERRNFQNKSKDSLLTSEEASSGSGGSASTSLEVNSEDVAATDDQISGAPRSAVLQACTLTSGLLLAGGLLLRQVSHLASLNGWPIADPTDVSFNFETWHLQLVAGLVIVISSSRYILLQTWSDFRDSSEAANTQILTSLEPLDYIVVACLPGISEELLFRGALMPTLGLNWISALMIGTIFGVLHLGNGRKYSFAIWATFVGFAYGIGTIASSSIIVPMASHSINNIIGGLLWRFTKNSQK
ncbi:hypothetical protein PAHAL_2G010900 [Panicum hallii]|uniref:CAAX prenyl protease 2/Lysostaphin resistance protein A-like domain-containing protein n=2 Tax=Panicum hallii TaxID=206008 RepID=A0A2T8KMH4_9POAL|nr:uncharacterized protein LOC112879458 isoform X1 [Panicum hallii]PVH63352.1 hypothetical protein PAHAL_2G010900 [Panicum hallii]